MRPSITQEQPFGCGIACFAFATEMTYREACIVLGPKQANSNRFWCKDLVNALNATGLNYTYTNFKPDLLDRAHTDWTIVLVQRSFYYPAGHYLIRYQGRWMDPWINLPRDRSINNAKSGFRKQLPERPMYLIFNATRRCVPD